MWLAIGIPTPPGQGIVGSHDRTPVFLEGFLQLSRQ